MGLVLQYRPPRKTTGSLAARQLAKGHSTGQIILFTGVRYERYDSSIADQQDTPEQPRQRTARGRRKHR
ncbi:MAG: hypothetical protein AAFY73_08005 [Pseudomonadota bacterium]